jgi:hypothetical protein
VVFTDDSHWDVTDVYGNEFGAFQRSIEVKTGDAHCHEACTRNGDDSVEKNLGRKHVGSGSGDFTRIVDSFPADDKPSFYIPPHHLPSDKTYFLKTWSRGIGNN